MYINKKAHGTKSRNDFLYRALIFTLINLSDV